CSRASPCCRKPARAMPTLWRRSTASPSIAGGATANSSACSSIVMSSPIAPWWDAASSGSSCHGWRAPRRRLCALASPAPGGGGRGRARHLLDINLRRLVGLGARSVFLEVDEGNVPALRLYRRAGFRDVGRRKAYYSADRGPAALILRRDLV